jgi:hypothetical protein
MSILNGITIKQAFLNKKILVLILQNLTINIMSKTYLFFKNHLDYNKFYI